MQGGFPWPDLSMENDRGWPATGMSTGRSTSHCSHHHVRLNRELRADLAWWCAFAQSWNGVGLLHGTEHPILEFRTNISSACGCGAWHGASWFQHPWRGETVPKYGGERAPPYCDGSSGVGQPVVRMLCDQPLR